MAGGDVKRKFRLCEALDMLLSEVAKATSARQQFSHEIVQREKIAKQHRQMASWGSLSNSVLNV